MAPKSLFPEISKLFFWLRNDLIFSFQIDRLGQGLLATSKSLFNWVNFDTGQEGGGIWNFW